MGSFDGGSLKVMKKMMRGKQAGTQSRRLL